VVDGGRQAARKAKVIVVMPAMNAARTLEPTVRAIPEDIVDEVLLVDDKSTDNTVELARSLPLHVIWHPHNVGYGGNQKTCYLEALQRDADVVVMLHPDGQYPPSLIPDLVEPILEGSADMVLGSRLAKPGMARAGGMPLYKYIANRALTAVENRVLGLSLSEMHSGYRNSLGFSFDSEVIMQAAQFGFRIAEVPAPSRYFDDASSIGPKAATVYGLKTLGAAARLVLHRHRVVRSRRFEP